MYKFLKETKKKFEKASENEIRRIENKVNTSGILQLILIGFVHVDFSISHTNANMIRIGDSAERKYNSF